MADTWWKDEDDLKSEQAEVLDLPLDQDLLITGPPGSGKTNLLLLRANYLFLGPCPNVQIVVYGSVLKKFIKVGGAQYKFPLDRITTHSGLFLSILRENGIFPDIKGMNPRQARTVLAEGMTSLLNEGKLGKLYEALVLDEAQDYSPEEITIFRAISTVLVAAADTRQKIFDVQDSSAHLKASIANVYPLKLHYRNCLDVCRVADGIMAGKPDHTPLVKHSNYNEAEYPSNVKVHGGVDIKSQAALIMEQIAAQRIAYPNELIGVLTVRNEELNEIASHIQTTAFADEFTLCHDQSFNADLPIWLSTISSAKGLEFRAVHLAGMEHISKTGPAQRRLSFTGVTRAKTALTVYHDAPLPGYFESALRIVAPSAAPIKKARLFGKD